MRLPLVLGKKLNGKDLIVDLANLPHLLIGGLTGFGKSNLIINIVDELAARKSPDEVNFLLIDPKMVEFFNLSERVRNYLYKPVDSDSDGAYTDLREAYDAISALCAEMERRYTLLQESRCRTLDEFNSKNEAKLPYIVLAIDEYADLFYCSSQYDDFSRDDEVEEEEDGMCDNEDASDEENTFITDIVRLGQKARATGIHVILSTQRPSTDIVCGIIKANYPARIAFKVQNKHDSLTVLDKSGAETLESPGDFICSVCGKLEFAHAPLSKDCQQ